MDYCSVFLGLNYSTPLPVLLCSIQHGSECPTRAVSAADRERLDCASLIDDLDRDQTRAPLTTQRGRPSLLVVATNTGYSSQEGNG